tara:strand:+ start:411 stop:950 length:540 start_codon:yes stop_codon:yes gene_type:complete
LSFVFVRRLDEKGKIANLLFADRFLYFFRFPEEAAEHLEITNWSYFENWNPYRNYLIAKEHCGLKEKEETNSGTFTNFAQNDQVLYALHTYLMYLKFGFGRANQDALIEIRLGAMDREQALNLVRLYDGYYPEEFIGLYLDYYQMSKSELKLHGARWLQGLAWQESVLVVRKTHDRLGH